MSPLLGLLQDHTRPHLLQEARAHQALQSEFQSNRADRLSTKIANKMRRKKRMKKKKKKKKEEEEEEEEEERRRKGKKRKEKNKDQTISSSSSPCSSNP